MSCVVVACLPCWNVSPPLKAGPGLCFCGLAHVRFPVNSSAPRHPGTGEVKHGSPPTSLCSPESWSKSHTTERQFVRSDATSDSQHRPRTRGGPGQATGRARDVGCMKESEALRNWGCRGRFPSSRWVLSQDLTTG